MDTAQHVGAVGRIRRAIGYRGMGRGAAVGVASLIGVLIVLTITLGRLAHLHNPVGLATLVVGVTFCVVGVLLATRRPDNAMGWCMLGGALFLGLSGVGGSLSVLAYRMHHTVPFAAVGVVLQPGWAPAIVCASLGFLLFPDGHFSSRAVKWATWLVIAVGIVWMGGALSIAVHAILTHSVRIDRTGNLLAIDNPRGAWAWWGVVQVAFFLLVGASWLLWLVQQVPRYRRASDEQRHQMKWLLSGVVVSLLLVLLVVVHPSGTGWMSAIGVYGLALLPVTIGIGVLKFHLYAVDRLVSRTLSYALLTGVVVGAYVGVVTFATKVVGFSSPVGVAASTLVAAALFNPARKRLQHVLDRRFNRANYDAERTVLAFAGRLRESLDPASVREDLMDVVHTAFEPTAAAIWIRRQGLDTRASN